MSAVGSVMTSEVDQPRAAAAPSTAGMWLGGVAALLVMRLPMSFLLLLVVPWIILLAQTRYRSGLRAGPLAALEVCCMVTAVIAVVFHPSLLTSIGNSAVIMLAVVGFTLAVFRSADPSKTARQSLSGLYWGALLVWFIGLGEILTGIKLLPLLYPEANTVSAVSKSRWIVTATYPNYNDYGVVMTMLFTALLAKMWFDPRRGAVKLGRLFALVTCFGLILMGGSRGTTLVVAAGGGLWMSPYVQDHSTAERGRIMTNAVSMLMSDPIALLFGYGSLSEYQNEANARFGDVLMDPHNLLLELVLRYGIVAMILFVACWLWIAVKGFLPRRPAVDWQAAFALTVVMLLPVLGIVPSSTLRYHVTWLYLVVASCLTAQMIASRRSELGTMVAHQERVDVTPDQSG